MNMFTPRGYTAVPQDAVSQDEDEVFENNNLSRSFDEQRKNYGASRKTDTMSTPQSSRESEETETKERRVKRNVRFESRSLEDKPEPMSNARRLCFVVSLMICTLTIFVFAFTVPCKGPSCNVANMITTVTSNLEKFHQNWSTVFPGYSTGIVFHLSSTKTREVVVSYDGKRVRGNDLRNEKFGMKNKWNTKESGLISLNEDNGKLLWLYNASDVVKLIECRTDYNDFEMCLIQSSHGRLQLINPKRNQIIWSTRILIGSILPSIIISINDCDGDDGRDVLLSYDRFNTTCMPSTNKTFCTHSGIVQLISGRTGYPLGTRLNIPQNHLIKRVSVHSTKEAENLIFVLTVGNKGHLKVISIQELYSKILGSHEGESPFLFVNSTVSVSDVVSTDHEPVVKDLNKDFVEDIILVTLAGNKHSLTAVDGGKLKRMWRIAFGSRKMLSQPVVGHHNDDEVPDILVILDDPVLSLFNQSLVQILDGQNGNIIWSRKLRLAKNTTPLSANVGYKNDVFLFWIEKESKTKYQKIFPSKKVERKIEAQQALNKARSFDTGSAGKKNVSDHAVQQEQRRHRSPRSVESREKLTSPVSDVQRELDSLVDEIFVKDFDNIPATTKPRAEASTKLQHKPRRIESKHKMLEDILKREGEPSLVIDKESGSLDGRPRITTTTRSSTQGPGLYDIHALHSKSSTRVRQRQMKINSHHSGNNGRKPSPTTLNLVTQRPLLYDNHALNSGPSKRVKNTAGNEHNAGRNPIPTVNLGGDIALATERHIKNNNPQVTTKKPSESHFLKDDKVTNEGRTITTTTKPSTKSSQRKRVEQLVVNSSGSRNDGSESNVITTSRVIDGRQSLTSTLPIEPSLNMQHKIYDITQRQSGTMADRETTVANTDNGGSGGRQSPTGTTSGLRGNIQSEPTRKIMNSRKMGDVIIQTPFNGRGSKNHVMQNPTITLSTMRLESHQRDVQIIKGKSTIRKADSGIYEDAKIHSLGKVESSAAKGNFFTANHVPKEVALPTTHARTQQDKKTISGSINNIKSRKQGLVSDFVPGRVLAPHPGFSVHPISTETSKTNSPVLDSSFSSDHHTPLTAEGMVDVESDKTRAGKDIVVMPSKTSTNKQPTRQNVQKPTEQKRQINSNTQTVTHKQQDANSHKQLLIFNEPTHTNSALSDNGNEPLDVDISHRVKNTIIRTTAMPSKDLQKHRQTISNSKPSTELKQASKANDDKNAVRKLINETNVLSSRGESYLSTKVKLSDNVLSNEEDKVKGNVGNATKNSHIFHPIKLNRTLHKSVQVEKQKSNKDETIQTQQPSQLLKTIQTNQSRLVIQHTTKKAGISRSKKKHHVECHKGYDLALIAIFPDSSRNSFTVISQENSVRKKKGSSSPSSCDTLWPTLNSSPLVHDADNDGFLEIVYAVNYGEETENERRMKVRKFSIKVDAED